MIENLEYQMRTNLAILFPSSEYYPRGSSRIHDVVLDSREVESQNATIAMNIILRKSNNNNNNNKTLFLCDYACWLKIFLRINKLLVEVLKILVSPE